MQVISILPVFLILGCFSALAQVPGNGFHEIMNRAERSYQNKDYADAVLYLKIAGAYDPYRQDTVNAFYRKLYTSLKKLQEEKAEGQGKKNIKRDTIFIQNTVWVTDSSALDSLQKIIDSLRETVGSLEGTRIINDCNFNNSLALSKLSSDLPLALKILYYNRARYSDGTCCPDSLCLKIDAGYIAINEKKFVLRGVFPHDTTYYFPSDTTKAILDGDFNPALKRVATTGTNDSIKLWGLDGNLLDAAPIWFAPVSISRPDSIFAIRGSYRGIPLWTLNNDSLSQRETAGKGRRISDFLISEMNGEPYILYLSKSRIFGEKMTSDGNRVFFRSRMNAFPPIDSLGLSKRKLLKFGWFRHNVSIWPPTSKKTRFWQWHSIRAFGISPTGSYFITGDKRGSIRYRNASGGSSQKLKRLNGAITTIDISENGRFFAAGSANGEVGIWNKEGNLLYSFYEQAVKKISSVKFAPGLEVLNGQGDKESIFYDFVTAGSKNGKLVVSVWKEKDGYLNLSQILPLENDSTSQSGNATSMKISPDGHHIMATTSEGKGYIWQSGKKLKEDIEALRPDDICLLQQIKKAGARLHEDDERRLTGSCEEEK